MFFKGNKKKEHELQSSDPFLMGRHEAAERYGYLSKNAAQWRRISLVLLLCCSVCLLAVIHTSMSVTVVPYIVQVDRHGYEIAVKPVAPAQVDARLIVATVGRYIWSLKTVFADPEAQIHLMSFIYNSTPSNAPAELKYKEYFRVSNPMEIGANYTVNTVVNSVLSLSEKTWQAEWTEEAFANGSKLWTKYYRGIFEVAVSPPKAMADVLVNPLGIFITDFNFSEIVGGK